MTETAEVETGSVAHELCRAAGHWPALKAPVTEEDADKFVSDLIKKALALTEAEYDGIPEDARNWIEEAVECKNNSLPVPELPGFDDVVAMNGEDKPAARVAKPEGDGEDPKTVAKKKRAAKKKGTEVKAEKTPRKLSGEGTVATIASIMLSNPDATLDELKKELTARKVMASESVIPTFRSAFRNFLSKAHSMGKLSKDLKITY